MTLRIALDAMGGERGPEEMVAGAIQAVEESDLDVVLIGDENILDSAAGLGLLVKAEFKGAEDGGAAVDERFQQELCGGDGSAAVAESLRFREQVGLGQWFSGDGGKDKGGWGDGAGRRNLVLLLAGRQGKQACDGKQ